MNRHAEIRKLLAVYDSLGAADRSAVDAHVKTCPACASRQKAYADMDARLSRLTDPLPMPSLARSIDAILATRQPGSRDRAGQGERRWSPARMLLPAGLLLLLILSVWLVMRVSTPVDHSVAQTPSVTPTQTPVALVSPQVPGAAVTGELLSWLATRDPASGTEAGFRAPPSAVRLGAPLPDGMVCAATLPVLGTVVAQR